LAARYRPAISKNTVVFSPQTAQILRSHTWPGNVRELANVVEHAMILADELPILPEHLPSRFGTHAVQTFEPVSGEPCTLREMELQAIYAALERHEGNKPKVADELGISLKTLYNKLNQTTALKKSA
jgi:two-component system NtrC family response regulator